MGFGQTDNPPASAADIDVLARTVFGEARDQVLAGQIAVAWCVMKRVSIARAYVAKHAAPHNHYGDGTIVSACKVHRQYDCWDVGDKNYALVNKVGMNDPAFQTAMHVALAVTQGRVPNALPEATHYYNPDAVSHTPSWVIGDPANHVPPARFEAAIGAHKFYSGVAA